MQKKTLPLHRLLASLLRRGTRAVGTKLKKGCFFSDPFACLLASCCAINDIRPQKISRLRSHCSLGRSFLSAVLSKFLSAEPLACLPRFYLRGSYLRVPRLCFQSVAAGFAGLDWPLYLRKEILWTTIITMNLSRVRWSTLDSGCRCWQCSFRHPSRACREFLLRTLTNSTAGRLAAAL